MAPVKPNTSRAHRRRPGALAAEFAKRQQHTRWLETHVWHAKRMHMTTKWGVRIADRPCEKSVRAAYRAVRSDCTIHDASYYSCVEVVGEVNRCVEKVNTLLSPKIVVSSALGSREVRTMMMTNSGTEAVAEVRILMQLFEDGDEEKTEKTIRMWVWTHPAATDAVFSALESACTDIDRDSISVGVLKNELLRFELRGPTSNVILWNTLQLSGASDPIDDRTAAEEESEAASAAISTKKAKISDSSKQNNDDGGGDVDSGDDVLIDIVQPRSLRTRGECEETWNLLSSLQNPSALPNGCVLSLVVHDPRLRAVRHPQRCRPPKPRAVAVGDARRLNQVFVKFMC